MERLVGIIVGGPPRQSRRSAMVWLALSLFVGLLVAYFVLTGDREPLTTRLFALFMVVGGVLAQAGDLLYERRPTLAKAVRLAGQLAFHVGILIFIVGMWLSGDRGWFWYSASVYALIMLVAVWHVAGKYRSGS
jgi:peptidoglycan/LPS O-acetylase OafA/YrhL